MTYDAREYSVEQGAPVLLVTFVLGQKAWRFARADQDLIHAGEVYTAPVGGIEPTRLRDSSETRKNDVTLTVDRSFPIAELWRVSPPTAIVGVRLVEIHHDEEEDAVAWMGHVSNVSWVGEARAEITLSPGAMAMKSNGLRRLWQKSCSHVLYGPKCRLSRWGDPVPAVVITAIGAEVSAAEFDGAQDLAGGRLTWADEAGLVHGALIVSHAGNTLTLGNGHPVLSPGDEVEVAPAAHQVAGELVEIDGLSLRSPAFNNGMKFNGGFIEWTDSEGVTDWRAITAHSGESIQIMAHAPRLAEGDTVVAVEGCARTIERCEELGNTPNFGGIPYFVPKNPFSGDPIY